MTKMTVDEFNDLLAEEMPSALNSGLRLEAMEEGAATMVLQYDASTLRPGGTISGPAMMMLADAVMYAAVLSMIGRVALAVTTSFNINFLRKPAPGDITAEGRVIKLGKRLAVIEVNMYSPSHKEPVAHATGTYSIPPPEKRGNIIP